MFIYAKTIEDKKEWMDAIRDSMAGKKQTQGTIQIVEHLKKSNLAIPENDIELSSGELGKGKSI